MVSPIISFKFNKKLKVFTYKIQTVWNQVVLRVSCFLNRRHAGVDDGQKVNIC